MQCKIEYKLSRGMFFNILLAARKLPAARQEECLKDLLHVFDRSVRGLKGNSLKTAASRFRNCDPELRSEYLRFGDRAVVDAFDARIRNEYGSVLLEMKAFSDRFLDTEVYGRWLVRALLELIDRDESIEAEAVFPVMPGGGVLKKDALLRQWRLYFYSFVLGVWFFLCSREKPEDGQETYFALSDFVSGGRPREFRRERIGFEGFDDVEVLFDTPEAQGLADVEAAPGEVIRGEAAPLQSGAHEILRRMSEPARRFQRYLNRLREKHSRKKSFLYEQQRPFYSFFVCNDIREREGGTVIHQASVDAFPLDQRCVLLSGAGGLGKSMMMMMTHLLLDAVQRFRLSGRLPVFWQLRDYDPEKGLMDFLLEEFFPEVRFFVSTRPIVNFRAFERFAAYELLPFDREKSAEMVERLDEDLVGPEAVVDFAEDLRRDRLRLSYEKEAEFQGNPLFLTILLLCYAESADGAARQRLFYERVYDAVARRHDAMKALKREFVTGLTSREFHRYFGEFCAITYARRMFDFTRGELEDAFQCVIDGNGLSTTPEAFVEEVTGKLCMMYSEGGRYFFVHR